MNKRKTLSCGIDIAAPGGVQALLDFHRKTFGDAEMRTAVPGDPAPTPTPRPADPPAPPNPSDPPPAPQDGNDPDDIPGLGDAGKRAIQRERAAREQADREKADLQRQLDERKRAEMSDLDKARDDAQKAKDEADKLRITNLRLTAIADHSVPKKYQHLVHGTDEESFAKSAQDVAELAAAAEGKTPPPPPNPPAEPVPGAGGGHSGSGGNNSGGTVSAGRDEYNRRHNKTKQ